MSEIVNKIKYAMSLRTPQEEALSYLDAISSHCDYKKDSKDVIEAVASEYCEKQRKVKAGFDFPSFCFAMATGIGKTRLMGACIYHLYKTKGYKDVIDPYYSLVGYFNSIRELGGAVRLLQDDIPKRIYRIKNKYDLDKQRYLNHNVEITSRMSSYKIPEKLNQLETTCASKDCLDTAIATNMIAVGMDVDRLGLMVVTGQPKQNSEYIQATSRIGRAFPGLVVTLYNAYRPRDLSHYENFTGYHSQLYRFVEGTTATPFSARARDRVMHALIISAIRLNFPNMANNPDAAAIGSLTTEQLDSVKKLIIDRLNIIKPSARADAEEEIDRFIDWWKLQAAQTKPLRYYVVGTERYNRLMNPYDQPHDENEKATLRSMREVESSANMFYYTED